MSVLALLRRAWRALLAWVRGEPERALPEIVYVDRDGVGWRERPEWQDADQPDRGQHDCWKRDMRVFLYRALLPDGAGEARVLDMRVVGLGNLVEIVPTLYPLGQQVADACRRLGFAELSRAAMPGLGDDDLRAIYDRQERAVAAEAERRRLVVAATGATWDEARMGYPHQHDDEEQTVALLTVGPFSRPGGAPLLPLALDVPAGNTDEFTARRVDGRARQS